MVVERAESTDFAAVESLLSANQLPIAGLASCSATMIVARHDGQVVGAAGLELYPDGALLRSVVVNPDFRGQRLGQRLTEAVLMLAEQRGARQVFLLTTTAEQFFPRFGFEAIDREQVPPFVRTSVEFTSACPTTATVMCKRLVSEAHN
jgi:amino-acid N-acetyltransferase